MEETLTYSYLMEEPTTAKNKNRVIKKKKEHRKGESCSKFDFDEFIVFINQTQKYLLGLSATDLNGNPERDSLIRECATRGMLGRGVDAVQAGALGSRVSSVYARCYIRLDPGSIPPRGSCFTLAIVLTRAKK